MRADGVGRRHSAAGRETGAVMMGLMIDGSRSPGCGRMVVVEWPIGWHSTSDTLESSSFIEMLSGGRVPVEQAPKVASAEPPPPKVGATARVCETNAAAERATVSASSWAHAAAWLPEPTLPYMAATDENHVTVSMRSNIVVL